MSFCATRYRETSSRWIGGAVALLVLVLGTPLGAPAQAADGGALDAALALYGSGPQEARLAELADQARDLGADPALLTVVLTRGSEAGVQSGDLLPVFERVIALAEADLPARSVVSRYLQGFSKGVPLARVHAAAAAVQGRLGEAATHLAPHRTRLADQAGWHAVLDHAAYALEVGVEPDYLDRSLVLSGTEGGDVSDLSRSPILALSFLVYAGIDNARSYELVHTAWDHGYRGDDLERLGVAVARLGQGEHTATEIAERVMSLIGSEMPADRIFQDLDALGVPGEGGLPPGMVPVDDPTKNRQVPGERPDQNTISRGSNGPDRRGNPDQSGGRGGN